MNQQIATLQQRIERCYVHHIDGKISTEEWEVRTAQWKREQIELRQQLCAHERADQKYMTEGVRLLEVAGRAHKLEPDFVNVSKKEEWLGC